MSYEKKKVSLEVVNPYAAGIDIGSRSHFVAIGQDADEVREFGVYAEDLQKACRVVISMELKQLPWSPLEHIGKKYFPPYKLLV